MSLRPRNLRRKHGYFVLFFFCDRNIFIGKRVQMLVGVPDTIIVVLLAYLFSMIETSKHIADTCVLH